MSDTTWTPSQIGQRIAQVVGTKMANSFWVRGEVSDVSRTARGSCFLSLIETDETGRVVARLPVTMAPGKTRLVDRRMARVGQPLTDGIEVRLRGHLEWYTPGGRLSVSLDDIDPAHTAGAMALARRDLLAALQIENLADANARRPLTRVPLRVGLITRGGSQAFHDALDELRASELPFRISLASASVQGVHAPQELSAAIRKLAAQAEVDVILLTRGGGAEIELATFDDPLVARAVAECSVQVWTGIGHHLDVPVAELVAARSFKTPTALAQGLVAAVVDATAATESLWSGIATTATERLRAERSRLDLAGRRTQSARVGLRGAAGRLDAAQGRLHTSIDRVVAGRRHHLDDLRERVGHAAHARLHQAARTMDAHAGLIDAYDPKRLLDRGWSVTTTADGRLVTAPLPSGQTMLTTTRTGTITSTVTEPEQAKTRPNKTRPDETRAS